MSSQGVPVWVYLAQHSRKGSISDKAIEKHWGFVMSSSEREIRVRLMHPVDLESGRLWRLDRSIDGYISFHRMMGAIGALRDMPIEEGELGKEYGVHGTILRDRLLEGFSAGKYNGSDSGYSAIPAYIGDRSHSTGLEEDKSTKGTIPKSPILSNNRIQEWVRRYAQESPKKREDDPPLPTTLNPSQVRAIAHMFGKQLSLVHGVSSVHC
jgi:hypothetical protein